MNKRLYHIGIIGTLALALAACSRTESVLPSAAEDYIRFGLPGIAFSQRPFGLSIRRI